MAKKIVFLITSNGIDGRAPTSIEFASFSEEERDSVYNSKKNKNKPYQSTSEKIIDPEEEKKKALAKLDKVDKMILGVN